MDSALFLCRIHATFVEMDLTLQKLSLINFKNYQEAELEFGPGVNCFTGENGEGKTNLLDGIYYLAFCKSYFNPIDSQNIRHGEPFFMVQGVFDKEEQEETVYCGMKRNEKKQFKRNKKEYSRLADHIGLLPMVIVSPADVNLILDGSEARRKFVDGVIAQFNKSYLDDLLTYNKALSQRNALLKHFGETRTFDEETLEIWDMQLAETGERIHQERQQFLLTFIDIFQRYFELISRGKELVSIDYRSTLNDHSFMEALKDARRKDRAVEYTTVGIHKDDLVFKLEGHPLKKFGSQGQQKSFLIALKLAQFDFIRSIKKLTPLLLLDDIFDKLDDQRVKALMKLVSEHNFGQIFITDTSEARLKEVFTGIDIEVRMFHISDGNVLKTEDLQLEKIIEE